MKKLFKIILVICFSIISLLNAQSTNFSKHYLKTGLAIAFFGTGDLLGPTLIAEYGYKLSDNFIICPRFTLSAPGYINENSNIQVNNKSYVEFNLASTYSYSLNICYSLFKSNRLKLGLGICSRYTKQIWDSGYMYDYEEGDHEMRVPGVYKNTVYGPSALVDYLIYQSNNINIGINGIGQLTEDIAWLCGIYIKIKS